MRKYFLFYAAMLGMAAMAQTPQVMGDVTGDGKVDIADVNIAINVMLGLYTSRCRCLRRRSSRHCRCQRSHHRDAGPVSYESAHHLRRWMWDKICMRHQLLGSDCGFFTIFAGV